MINSGVTYTRVFVAVLACTAFASAFNWLGNFQPFGKYVHKLSTTNLNAHKSFALMKEKYSGRVDLTSMTDIDEYGANGEDFVSVLEEDVVAPPKVGDSISGVVIEMDDNGAMLEIAGKMSGYLPLKEAALIPPRHVSEVVEVGQQITAEVVGTLRGMPVISFRSSQLVTAWEKALKVRAADEAFDVEVIEVNRGGAVCQCFGLKAFLPGSHFVGMPDESVIGRTIKVKFLDLIEEEGKVVVSQRAAVASDAPDLVRGEVMSGTVTGLRNYGAFMELDAGQAGLLHISQISYDRVDNLEQLFTIGQRLKVMILEFDKAKGRVALSTKALEPNPGDMLRGAEAMQEVFDKAEDTARRYHARLEAERVAREEAAKEIVAGLAGASRGGDEKLAGAEGAVGAAGKEGYGEQLASVAESIESILASIVADSGDAAAPTSTAPAVPVTDSDGSS